MAQFRGGLISKSLCGIPYKKFFKIPQGPLFLTFCMGDYKSLAAISALRLAQFRKCNKFTLTHIQIQLIQLAPLSQ
jgi:hypothetical protein